MPDTPGAPRLPVDRFEALCESEEPLPELPDPDPDPVSEAIAAQVLSLLRPGGTLQLGLGRLQTAILQALETSGFTDLGYHAGMISIGLAKAMGCGVFGRGVTTGVALGDQAFYARLSDLPVRFAPVGVTHAVSTLAAVPGLVSVNSVLQVDLSGQANGEFLGGQQISGHGGMVDFIRGARASDGGSAVLALPSTTRGGESRIVPRLGSGVPVSVARSDVDLVVTEYGVADLREASLGERARRLAAVAAPEHRDTLLEQARGLA
jgi:acyl-CoA hydrolase